MERADLYAVFIRRPRILTSPAYRAEEDSYMDAVAILIGIVMFACLLGLIYGIEWI
jgi:hypothetical protein